MTVQADYLGKLQKDYLLVAVPGAGKTFWTMHTARELMKAGRISSVVIVAPTTHVKRQWAATAHELGIEIERDYRNSDGSWPRDADGVAMTYSQMFEQAALHYKNVSRKPTLVVLDEVHHLQDAAGWGQAALQAFDAAAFRIHLSGTPWNKDGFIPWIAYDVAGKAISDASYTYEQSLTDGVNCDVFFPKLGGRAEWQFDGQVYQASFEDKLSESDRSRRLATILQVPESDFIARTFTSADDELSRIRQLPRQDRSGGLIIARDRDHAEAIADLIRDTLHKPRPTVITSDKPSAANDIRLFTAGTDRWVVAVRMISEGVDIPRLRVLIYATNYTTRLFFRQAVGRVIRGPEPPAVVFIPSDPILLKYAAEIREERIEALRKQTDRLTEIGEPPASTFRPVKGETFADGVLHAEGAVTQAEIDHASGEIRAVGGQPTVEQSSMVARILRRRNPAADFDLLTAAPAPEPDSPMKSDRKDALRRATNKIVTSYCFSTGGDYQALNYELNKEVGIKNVRSATEDQLQKRYQLAKDWCGD